MAGSELSLGHGSMAGIHAVGIRAVGRLAQRTLALQPWLEQHLFWIPAARRSGLSCSERTCGASQQLGPLSQRSRWSQELYQQVSRGSLRLFSRLAQQMGPFLISSRGGCPHSTGMGSLGGGQSAHA